MDYPDPDFPVGAPELAEDAADLARSLRQFLDLAASAKAETGVVRELIADLARLSDRLKGVATSEEDAIWRKAPRNRPIALLPAFTFRVDGYRLEGSIRFGRFHVGRHAAHGGAIGLVFDEILGALVASRGRPARTAYLRIDFRSLVPLDTDLQIKAWFALEEGRKRLVHAEIRNGDVVCAECEGLWVALRADQR